MSDMAQAGLDAQLGRQMRGPSAVIWLCGGAVLVDHPALGLVDVMSVRLPSFSFQPSVHVHYGEKVLSIPDGLPKYKDMPKEFGGSGETLPE